MPTSKYKDMTCTISISEPYISIETHQGWGKGATDHKKKKTKTLTVHSLILMVNTPTKVSLVHL